MLQIFSPATVRFFDNDALNVNLLILSFNCLLRRVKILDLWTGNNPPSCRNGFTCNFVCGRPSQSSFTSKEKGAFGVACFKCNQNAVCFC